MQKRKRIQQFLSGAPYTDGVPAAFFQHFQANNRMGMSAVRSQINYFRESGMDIAKIMFDDVYPKISLVESPEDWSRVGWAHPKDRVFDSQLDVTKRIVDELGAEACVYQTIFSPFVSAGCAVSPILQWDSLVTDHMRKNPKAMAEALQNVSESLLEFALRMTHTGIDGFYVSVQGGEHNRFDRDFFHQWLRPSDLIFLNGLCAMGKKVFIHFCGTGLRAEEYFDYPGDIINMAFADNGLTLAQAEKSFGRPIMGGLSNHGVLCTGSQADITAEVRLVLSQAPKTIMLGADCTVPANVPMENLRWAIEAAHQFK